MIIWFRADVDLPKKIFYEKVLFTTQLRYHLMRKLMKNSKKWYLIHKTRKVLREINVELIYPKDCFFADFFQAVAGFHLGHQVFAQSWQYHLLRCWQHLQQKSRKFNSWSGKVNIFWVKLIYSEKAKRFQNKSWPPTLCLKLAISSKLTHSVPQNDLLNHSFVNNVWFTWIHLNGY